MQRPEKAELLAQRLGGPVELPEAERVESPVWRMQRIKYRETENYSQASEYRIYPSEL